MDKTMFTGSGVALITPFTEDGVDYEAFGKLIDWQIEQGTDALIVCGTTGEPATMTWEERVEAIDFAVKRTAGRVPVFAGTGGNCTRVVIDFSKKIEKLGVDGLLVVTPYYNKTTQEGLIAHFTALADAVNLPIIMYNVPSRTGVNLEPRVVAELAKHPMLCALKDACTDAAHMTDMARLCGDGIAIYSGSDECVLQALALGAHGLISVAANVIPSEMHALTMNWIRGDTKACRNLAFHWMPLINCLSSEVNPIPVKAALGMMGKLEETLRLPLAPLDAARREALRRELKRQSLIE